MTHKFIITTDNEDVAKSLYAFISTLEVIGAIGAEKMAEAFTFESDIKTAKLKAAKAELKGRAQGARIQYRAILPENEAERRATVLANLKVLGAGTITGLIYQEIVNRTVAGEMVTEPMLRKEMKMAGGTSQRSIGDLCRMNIVSKEPIVVAG